MKKLHLIFILLIASAGVARASAPADSLLQKKIEGLALSVKKRFAPDKRAELFSVEFEQTDPLRLKVETTSKEASSFFRQLLSQEKITASFNEHILPSSDLHGLVYGVASLSVCNNRVAPNHTAELVSQTLLGTPVEILKKKDGYYLVRTPDRYISWTEDAGIAEMNKTDFLRWKQLRKVVFTADYGHAYSKPSDQSDPVSDLVAGNILQLTGKKGKFYEVAYPDGRRGFVPVRQMELFSTWAGRPNPDASAILRTARSLTGVPYLWGGTSIKGVDCSGFTKTTYYLNGIVLARDASQQALTGQSVDVTENDSVSLEKCLKNLQPGDLLFFGRKAPGASSARIIHTAIYIGNGEFIQSVGQVKVSSLIKTAANYDEHQSRTLAGARRILTAIGTEGISRIDRLPLYQTTSK